MKRIGLLLSIFLCSSCSLVRLPRWGVEKEPDYLADWRAYNTKDYQRQLASLGPTFLKTDGIKEIKLPKDAYIFLTNTALTIIQTNELFFREQVMPTFHVVESAVPYHFSLPGRSIYLSTALIERFLKHEAQLASVISYELVRSEKSLYNRAIIVPIGYMPLDRILGLNRISTDDKIEIHKWAYHSLRRAGFDGEYYLSWLQLMNRNTADFLPLLGDASSISREEAMFKGFLISRANSEDVRAIARKESSKEFYRFIFFLKDRSS